jgi:hypothetical protein
LLVAGQLGPREPRERRTQNGREQSDDESSLRDYRKKKAESRKEGKKKREKKKKNGGKDFLIFILFKSYPRNTDF